MAGNYKALPSEKIFKLFYAFDVLNLRLFEYSLKSLISTYVRVPDCSLIHISEECKATLYHLNVTSLYRYVLSWATGITINPTQDRNNSS